MSLETFLLTPLSSWLIACVFVLTCMNSWCCLTHAVETSMWIAWPMISKLLGDVEAPRMDKADLYLFASFFAESEHGNNGVVGGRASLLCVQRLLYNKTLCSISNGINSAEAHPSIENQGKGLSSRFEYFQ